jgi:hypothetical protein
MHNLKKEHTDNNSNDFISHAVENAMIECLQIENELLKKQYELMVFENAKKLNSIGAKKCANAVYNMLGKAYMEVSHKSHDVILTNVSNCLKICNILIISIMGGGGEIFHLNIPE